MSGKQENEQNISRRDFIKVTGAILLVVGTGGWTWFETEEDSTPPLTLG
jgi:hypothetical protein